MGGSTAVKKEATEEEVGNGTEDADDKCIGSMGLLVKAANGKRREVDEKEKTEGQTANMDEVREVILQAKLLENRGNSAKAVEKFLEARKMIVIDENSSEETKLLVADCYCHLGLCAMSEKNVNDACQYYEEALRINPKDKDAMLGIALLLNESSPLRAREAVEWLKAALQVDPEFAEAKRNLAVILTDIGVRLKHAGLPSEAFQLYSDAVKVDPDYAQAYYNLGVAYADTNMKDQALECYSHTLQRNPLHAEALCNAGVIYKEAGNLETAILNYERALVVNPNFQLAKYNLAIALCDAGTHSKQVGNMKEAFRFYKRSLVYNPSYADAHYNLGVAYAEARKPMRSAVHYELAVHFNPNHTEAHNNLGVIYKDLGNLEKSLECYKAALEADSNNHQTHNNIAVLYTLTGNVDLAARHLEMATRLAPNYAEAHNNIGVLLRDQGDVLNAIKHYEVCFEVDPTGEMGKQNRLHALNYVESYTPFQIFEAHYEWGREYTTLMRRKTQASSLPKLTQDVLIGQTEINVDQESRGRKKPLRIGYISPDFFTHSVSYFIEAMLAKHTHEVEVFVYSNVQKGDAKTEKLRGYEKVNRNWRDVFGLKTAEAIAMILEDKIDVLVELAGHTNGNRLDVMSLRVAPVQVTWIGYPNTTGLSSIDYRVTDAIVDPVNTKQKFSEKLWRLPKVFLCYTPSVEAPEEAGHPPAASSGGLITFGSFNILAKMQAGAVTTWATILKRVPNSRLLLKAKPFASTAARTRVEDLFRKEGIEADRLDLYPLIASTSSHLEAYRNMDIGLDPFPYAGTTTTCEALYMGVPVVTLASPEGEDFHAHNVGVTLLKTIGHKELVATSKEEYVEIVCDLAGDPQRLKALRKSLRSDMIKSPLGDAETFVRDVEAMFYGMWAEKGGSVGRRKGLRTSSQSTEHTTSKVTRADSKD